MRASKLIFVLLFACQRDVSSLRLTDTLPASPDNPFADNEDAARLGFMIFFDARFSADGETRCATCHQPERAFADGETHNSRNTPTVLNAAREPTQFWDGRIDALWKQPRDAFEHEMGFGEAQIAERIAKSYREEYEALFGPIADGVTDNIGRALEAYMRKIATGESRFDAYARGDGNALTAEERRGLDQFMNDGCATCHAGPTLGAPALNAIVDGVEVKTPSLRNVALTAPYLHDGGAATLEDAVTAHGAKATPELIAFLRALNGAYPPPPWNNWPDK